VEATKFTEVGYVGRDVDSIVRDLTEAAVKMVREAEMKAVQAQAQAGAEERILDAMLSGVGHGDGGTDGGGGNTRERFRQMLRNGSLDERELELELSSTVNFEIMTPPGMEEMTRQLQGMFETLSGSNKKRRRLKVKRALELLIEEEARKLLDDDAIRAEAVEKVEQHGVVFLDEFDKICAPELRTSAGVSREGVQRDLLPLVEGCTVTTKYGMVRTDHVLFIGSGSFHDTKPADLIPELQGRFPIRVELQSLSSADFERILVEPSNALTEQYCALLGTEGVELSFTRPGIRRIAEIAWQVNEHTEDIGARRLHTVLERLLEELSFHADEHAEGEQDVVVDADYVERQLGELLQDKDLQRYIL